MLLQFLILLSLAPEHLYSLQIYVHLYLVDESEEQMSCLALVRILALFPQNFAQLGSYLVSTIPSYECKLWYTM